jgi:hypothetical protein
VLVEENLANGLGATSVSRGLESGRDILMKRTAVIAGIAVVMLLLGIVAFVHRPSLVFAQAHGLGMMGGAGMHGMGHGMGRAMMGAGSPQAMGPDGAGCPMATAALTPEQREERAKTFAEHYIQQFLPGYTLEKKTTN